LKVDKYLHDLLEETILREAVNPHGLENSSARKDRWARSVVWVEQEIEKNGRGNYSWWSQEREDWHLWIDFGFLFTEEHGFQDAHTDYLRMKEMQENWIAFMSLTDSGMLLQVSPERPVMPERFDTKTREGKLKLKQTLADFEKKEGVIVFLPKGVGLAVGGDVCHGGSILCEPCKEYEAFCNPRFHCYIREKKFDETLEKKRQSKSAANTRGASYSNSVGIWNSKGNRWKDYDSECDSEDYNCDDADAALRKDMVLCRELRVTNHRGIQSYSGVDGELREKLNDTIFG
jgi:hypothetical protein